MKNIHINWAIRSGYRVAMLAIILTFVGLVTAASAQSIKPPVWKGLPGIVISKLVELGVTSEQKLQVKDVLQTYYPILKVQREAIEAEKDVLKEMLTAEFVDEYAVRSQAHAIADLTVDHALVRAEVRKNVLAIATPDQQEILGELKQDLMAFRDQIRKRFDTWLYER